MCTKGRNIVLGKQFLIDQHTHFYIKHKLRLLFINIKPNWKKFHVQDNFRLLTDYLKLIVS